MRSPVRPADRALAVFGRAGAPPQARHLLQTHERLGLHRISLPAGGGEHPQRGQPGGVPAGDDRPRTGPPARRSGRAGGKLRRQSWRPRASANADYAYSGWLFGYLHLSNALYEADPALAAASYQTLCAEARADLAANNAYWKQWEGPVKQTGEKVYTTFLQGYGQDLGMRSYGACVDLLVEEFLTNTTSCD